MTRWASIITGRPLLIASLSVVFLLLSGIWGIGVLDRLNLAGYTDPGSDSAQVDELIADQIGRQTPDVVAIFTAPQGQSADDIEAAVLNRLNAIDHELLAKPIESYWTSAAPTRLAMVSADRNSGLAVLTLAGNDGDRLKAYDELKEDLVVPGIKTQLSGYSAVTDAYNTESTRDIVIAEAVAVPLTLVLLVVIFGGVVAASVPVVVGGLAVFGSLGALRLISTFTDVSAFALNTASVLGLGLAIDYSLFVVSRFREELGNGLSAVEAAQRSVRTAGRTVAFSALLLICALAGTMVFPISMMRSLGFGAISAVAIAAFLSVTAVPAALTLLGERIDALPWRRGAAQRGEARARRVWGSLADWVIRRPVVIAVSIVVVLLAMCIPLRGLEPAGIDPNGLPRGNAARVAQETVTAEFPLANNGVTLLVQGSDGALPSPEQVHAVIAAAQRVDGVQLVVQQAGARDFVVLHAVLSVPDFTYATDDSVDALRELAAPPGTTVLIGGENAVSVDSNAAIRRAFPIMLVIMVCATLLLMLIAFRSVVLPLKAVAMAGISLGATFGLLTWVFQDGHGAELLGVDAGPLPFPGLVVVVAAVFGLSTDYEVFLISRMVEAHNDGADTATAIRAGVAGTGRVITAAASLLIIVTGATALSDVNLIKIVGLGLAVAIIIDATVVRMLLVPALVKLMGNANWWMPGRRSSRELRSVS